MLFAVKLLSLVTGLIISSAQAPEAVDASTLKIIHTKDAVTEYSLQADGPAVVASWQTPDAPRAIVLAIHGFGLHKYTYAPFAEGMREKGIATYALDVRGFGEWSHADAENKRLNVEKALADIKETLLSLKEENPNTPIFLLGESMGGAMALRVASEQPNLVAGVISSVPSGQIAGKKRMMLEVAVKFLLKGGARVDMSKQILGKATRDAKLASAWLSDVNVRMKVGKSELWQFAQFMRGNDVAAKNISQTAVLMVQGERDQLIKPEGTVRLYQELNTTDKSMMMVEGGEHLIFEEGQFDHQVLSRVSKWMIAHSSQDSLVAYGR